MKLLILSLGVVFGFGGASAQTPGWQPPSGQTQVPIWPGAAPDAQPVAGPEATTTRNKDHFVGGKPWTYISNVARPTITVYSPRAKNTGAAVVVFPGGGYQIVAIDLEGTEVCDWLTSRGITCALLKYRVPGLALYPKSAPYPKSGPYPQSTPPTFLLQNEDDHVDRVEDALSYGELKKAGVSVEMHLYAQGGHAFGLRPTKFPVTRWPKLVETWLATLGVVSQ